MDNGTIWGHGAYLGPDFSAQLSAQLGARRRPSDRAGALPAPLCRTSRRRPGRRRRRRRADAEAQPLRSARRGTLTLTAAGAPSRSSTRSRTGRIFRDAGPQRRPARQRHHRSDGAARSSPRSSPGPPGHRPPSGRGRLIPTPTTFPMTRWPAIGPTSGAVLWSALSLIFLLGGTAIVLLAFGKFDYLGWHRAPRTCAARMPARAASDATRSRRRSNSWRSRRCCSWRRP